MGVPSDDARVVVDVQLDADMRGVDTHGFQRLPWYVGYIRRGENDPRPSIEVVRETPASVLLDAGNAIGQLACVRLIEATIAKARGTGLAVGASRNSNDWGCGAHYPLLASREGFVCFGTTTSVPTLAPFGSRTRMLGNNPMVFAIPRRESPPIVLDMALTPVALGKVMRAQAEGTTIPAEWGFRDSDGRATTDPATALAGIIPAIGGYKGTGLSMMMNVLAGILPQGDHSAAVRPGHRGQTFWVISPALFGEPDAFAERIEDMCRQLHAAEALPGEQVFLPGEIEENNARRALERGTLDYPPSVIRALRETGEALGVPYPG
jgi:LDH2 family malate/lactate/ureidoglycolate dehydrogenase